MSKCTSESEEQNDCLSSLGSPESPTCLTDDETCIGSLPQKDTDLFGVDMTIRHYDEVEKSVDLNEAGWKGIQWQIQCKPLFQTLSLISGCGQFRFEFTYTDY